MITWQLLHAHEALKLVLCKCIFLGDIQNREKCKFRDQQCSDASVFLRT